MLGITGEELSDIRVGLPGLQFENFIYPNNHHLQRIRELSLHYFYINFYSILTDEVLIISVINDFRLDLRREFCYKLLGLKNSPSES